MRTLIMIVASCLLFGFCTMVRAEDVRAKAIMRIEAESAEAGPGIEIDRGKAATASGGAVLGVHCDRVPQLACRWKFNIEKEQGRVDLLLRFAGMAGGNFTLSLDGRRLGTVELPATGGWGGKATEWRTGRISTEIEMNRGPHTLEMAAVRGSKPINLDWLAFAPGEMEPIKFLIFKPEGGSTVEKPIELPAWSPADKAAPGEAFFLDPRQATQMIWGRGRAQATRYFEEFLPGLFERTLALEEMNLGGGKLEWVFTGDVGGVTVALTDVALEVIERFYESEGFGQIEGAPVEKHPEFVTKIHRVEFEGKPQALTVAMDHKLQLRVSLNGREVLQKTCCIDLTKHQVRLSGSAGSVRGRCTSPAMKTCNIAVDPAVRHQTMIGFGGITTPTAFAQLSPEGKRRWWEMICEYNLLIQREYPIGTSLNRQADNWERLADATPHYYADNFPNGEISDFDYIRTLRKLGGKVWFEFWMQPPWTNQDWRDASGKLHTGVVDPPKYVAAMLAYCRAMQKRTGTLPDVLGIQNERQQPLPLWYEMTTTLRKELDKAGFKDVRIHMSDSGRLNSGIAWLKQLRTAPEAWAATDYAASHQYDYQACFTDPDRFDAKLIEWKKLADGKPFLSTELCVNSRDYQWKSYRLAFSMGQLYYKNLVLTDAAAICYCWTLLNVVQPSYGWTRTLAVPDPSQGFVPKASSHQLRVFGAFSRRVREGMIRVEAQSNDPDLLVSAFTGADGKKTVILANRSTAPRTVRLAWPDAAFTEAEMVDPYRANKIEGRGEESLKGPFVLPPGAILTLSNVPLGRLPAGVVEEEAQGP
jgi:O-glycosyl hydrolase